MTLSIKQAFTRANINKDLSGQSRCKRDVLGNLAELFLEVANIWPPYNDYHYDD